MAKPASNNQIKEWRKLLMGKYRNRTGLFLAEGLRCVEQILQNGLINVTALLSDGSGAAEQLERGEIPVYELSSGDFASISDTETPQGVIAVCHVPQKAGIGQLAENEGVILALDAIQDPGNMGTIIRTAAWFGIRAIFAGTGCVDPYQPKVVRSTAGATGAIPFLKGNLDSLLGQLESSGWHTFLLDSSEEAKNIRTIKPPKKLIMVAGNEANGIRPELFASHRTPVRIEGYPAAVESLNVAVALGISLFGLNTSF